MAYKVVITKRLSIKLVTILAYLEKNFPPDVYKSFADIIDRKIMILSQQPGRSAPSSRLQGVYNISISNTNKLYYLLKGRKIILLDILVTNTIFE